MLRRVAHQIVCVNWGIAHQAAPAVSSIAQQALSGGGSRRWGSSNSSGISDVQAAMDKVRLPLQAMFSDVSTWL